MKPGEVKAALVERLETLGRTVLLGERDDDLPKAGGFVVWLEAGPETVRSSSAQSVRAGGSGRVVVQIYRPRSEADQLESDYDQVADLLRCETVGGIDLQVPFQQHVPDLQGFDGVSAVVLYQVETTYSTGG